MPFQYCSTERIYFQSLFNSYVKQCIVCTYFCTHSWVSCMFKNQQWRLNSFLYALICIVALFILCVEKRDARLCGALCTLCTYIWNIFLYIIYCNVLYFLLVSCLVYFGKRHAILHITLCRLSCVTFSYLCIPWECFSVSTVWSETDQNIFNCSKIIFRMYVTWQRKGKIYMYQWWCGCDVYTHYC